MKLTIGFSPCPNDTFIFDALLNNKIHAEEFEFELFLEDVETLNCWALEGKLEVTKLSFGVLPLVEDQYQLLDAGSALGTGVGPLLISKKLPEQNDISDWKVYVPGEHTTAHMLFSLAYPQVKNKEFVRYDEIENLLLESKNEELIAGVIIHENRFTYKEKGLELLTDLGQYWEDKTALPIPLGGIVAKRSLPEATINKLNELIRKSISYSWAKYPVLSEFITLNAQEMSEEVMRKHINLYVNKYSESLGEEGKIAVSKFREVYQQNKAE